ncbi:amidohydrolase family protein [Candidatus Micrarchaeota archaeon]|nr:amidohydrolase family protein [Candidatus Micrarchaeota archaeon]
MIRSGTTCFNEMYVVDVGEIATAASEIGVRATIAHGLIGEQPEKQLAIANKFIASWSNKNDLITPAISCHAPYSCSEELLIKSKKLAKKKKLKFHIHVSETRKEVFDILKKYGSYPVEYLHKIGIVDSDSIFAHAGWLTKREIGILGKARASIASCPISNLKLATGGIAQLYELNTAGATVALGSDGPASNNSHNMFETLKMASLLQKHHYWKADILSTEKVFDFATIKGAKALGLDCGEIKEGKLADLVLLDRKSAPNLWPNHDLLSNIVYVAGPQNVSDVIINGKIVMHDRVILTVDEEKVIEKANAAAMNVVKRK